MTENTETKRAEIARSDLLAVLEPVLSWYQPDEDDPREPLEIIKEIVVDLQADRVELLALEKDKRRLDMAEKAGDISWPYGNEAKFRLHVKAPERFPERPNLRMALDAAILSANIQEQTCEALSASPCSASDSEGDSTGLSGQPDPINAQKDNLDNLTNECASFPEKDSHNLQEEVSELSSPSSSRKKDTKSQSSSHPQILPLRDKTRCQKYASKMYWNGSLVERILNANDKMILVLENEDIIEITQEEFRVWLNSEIPKQNVKGDSRLTESEGENEAAPPNDSGTPTRDGSGVDVHRLVSLLHFGGGLLECGEYSLSTEDQDDNFVLAPFLALLWFPPEHCRPQVQLEPSPHLLIPRHLYDSPQVNRLLEKLVEKLWEIYPDSFLLTTSPTLLQYNNPPCLWWKISLPHFVNLAQRILCIDSEYLIEADKSLTVSSHAIWRQTQMPKLNMSWGGAAYEYHKLANMESEFGESFFLANVSVDSSPKAIDVPRLDRPRLFGEFL